MLILKTRCLKMTGQRRMHSFQSSILFSCMYNHTLIINYQALKCNCCWNSVMLASYSDFCKQTIFVEYTWKNLLNIYNLRDLHVLRYWWDPLQKSTQAYIVKLLPRDPQTFPRKLWGVQGRAPDISMQGNRCLIALSWELNGGHPCKVLRPPQLAPIHITTFH